MRTLISGGHIVNENKVFDGYIAIEDGSIIDITDRYPEAYYDEIIDASGCFILPGIIDDHVHFREPGLTSKADIDSESRAAAAGGVTSFFDMPNTVPQTTNPESLADKFTLASQKSHVNYSFFYGATNNNVDTFSSLDTTRIPGIKLFMGSSTGNMLVDRKESLERIFSSVRLPLMVHCEDTDIINSNMQKAKAEYGDDPEVLHHYLIRSEEACYASTSLAVSLARKYGTRLHVAHLSTERELQLFGKDENITAEAVIGHLWFTHDDHLQLGARIKVNPSIKTISDRDALRRALSDGRIAVVGTDHAPHLLEHKTGGCARAASGMPMIQFSLVTMLELVDAGVLTLERLVQLMCHQPALLFGVQSRGFLRLGYRADLVIVRPHHPWTVTKALIESKCGWSPVEGHEYQWYVERTICNGNTVYADGHVFTEVLGEEIIFNHAH